MRGILITFLVFLATAASAEEEWVRLYEPYLPGAEPVDAEGNKEVVAVRLVRWADGTLRAVAGGRVSCWTEETLNLVPAAQLAAEATTDEFGIANLRSTREGGEHWLFEGKGGGSVHEFHAFATWNQEQVVLESGIDVPIEILDPFGRPLVGADVEIHLGCPHAPALRRGVTGKEGELLFRDLENTWDFAFWIRAPGVDHGPYDLEYLTVGTNGRFRVVTQPAVAVSGQVLDENGKPFPGVVVRCHGWRRGPRTKTDAEGRFTLQGAIGDAVCFHDPRMPFGDRPSCVVPHYEPAVPLIVRLRKDRPTSMGDGEVRHHVEVRVGRRIPMTGGGETVGGADRVPVRLVRKSDGLTLAGRTGQNPTDGRDGHGLATFLAPPGDYRVLAGGGFEEAPAMEAELRVPRDTPEPLRMSFAVTDRQPVPEWTGVWPAGADGGMVHLPGRSRYRAKSRRLPATGRAVWFAEEPVRWVTPAGEVRNGAREFVWNGPEPTRVKVRFDPALPEDVQVRLQPRFGTWREETDMRPEKSGAFVLRTWSAGPAVLRVFAEKFADPFRSIDLPFEAGKDVDLGVVKLRPRRERIVRIPEAAGHPFDWSLDQIADRFLEVSVDRTDDGGITWSDSDRTIPVSLAFVGDVEEEGYARATMFLSLGPDTPDVAAVPAGRITANVTGPDGPLAAVVFLDHDAFEFPNGRLDIRGLADGPHTLIVGARGHFGQVRRFLIRDSEPRNFEIVLPRREK